MRCYKGCLFLVGRGHGDLVVSGEGVQKGEHSLSDDGVYDLVYPRQRETVFWARIVEIGVIDTHPSFSFLFGDHYYICQPIWILHFSNKYGFQQFVNLISDNFLSVWVKTPNLLQDRSCERHDVKLMGGD